MMPRSQFTDLFLQVLSEKLADPHLNGAELAKDMGMSRMHLHRHLRRYFNQPAGKVILSARLHQARQLLLIKHLTIKEISLTIGYRDPAYFSRVFRQAFGVSPTDFRINEAS